MSLLPEPGSRWRHHNGNEYTVRLITNLYSIRLEEYPVTVVYEGDNGRVWSKTIHSWYKSMEKIS